MQGIPASDLYPGLFKGPNTVDLMEPTARNPLAVEIEADLAPRFAALQVNAIPGAQANHYLLGMIGVLVAASFIQQMAD